jgi:copper oxidase (laccase) domain-containing protein
MEDLRTRSLFGGQLNVAITTKAFGEVHPGREDFADQFARLQKITGSPAIMFPRLAFTNRVARLGDFVTFPDVSGEPLSGFFRSTAQADGAISGTLPVAICNADCPIGVFLTTPNDAGKRMFGLVHLGLMTMISKDGRSSILQELVNQLYSHGLRIDHFWMGFGSQSCCYGLNQEDDRWPLIREWQPEILTVEKGPRAGQWGVDLGTIARNQLISDDVPSSRIEIDNQCTVCSGGDPEEGEHFSNLMRHGATGRNAAFVWLA